jgi:hypothetical protein
MSNDIRKNDLRGLKPTLQGWGILDVNYVVQKKEIIRYTNKKPVQKVIWVCPYYRDWSSMIIRCFNKKYQDKYPTYKGCTIHEDLSNFIKWVDSQPNRDWQNCQLDKDFLSKENKHYSPETVSYISNSLNSFITNTSRSRGALMLGVTFTKKCKTRPYQAQCSNPFNAKNEFLGYFATELDAHKAWQAKKHEYACQLADLQENENLADKLRTMYNPDNVWVYGNYKGDFYESK